MLKTHKLQKQSVKVNNWERNCIVYIRSVWQHKYTVQLHCSVVSSEAGTLNSVLCSSAQAKREQLACFARTYAMALELVHNCRLWKQWRRHGWKLESVNRQIQTDSSSFVDKFKSVLFYNEIMSYVTCSTQLCFFWPISAVKQAGLNPNTFRTRSGTSLSSSPTPYTIELCCDLYACFAKNKSLQ